MPAFTNDFDVTFFPEGGALLAVQHQNIAFKAQGADGFSKEIEGFLLDSQGDTLTSFHSEHKGMGIFTLNSSISSIIYLSSSSVTLGSTLPFLSIEASLLKINMIGLNRIIRNESGPAKKSDSLSAFSLAYDFGRISPKINTRTVVTAVEMPTALVSTEKISIEKERLFADYTKNSIIKAAEDDVSGMMISVYIFIAVAAIVFFIITFLMIKLMIDRAKMNISLMKVFGFNRKEIRKLYINGNFYLILASLFVGMPISKLFVDKVWFAVSNQNIEAGYDTHYPIFFYIIITGVVIAMYFIITFILNSVINKIHMSEVLKNRE